MTIVIGVFVEAIANADPDLVEHRQRLDDINRFVQHFKLPIHTAIDLRLYHRERKGKLRADRRMKIVEDFSPQLKGKVLWEVNKSWLVSVPCFMFVNEKDYLVRISQNAQSIVYMANERPPARRLYVIEKGTCFYKSKALGEGDSWGAEDVLLTYMLDDNRRRAYTATCSILLFVEQRVFEELREEFPRAYFQTRVWAIYYAVGEYMIREYRKRKKEFETDEMREEERERYREIEKKIDLKSAAGARGRPSQEGERKPEKIGMGSVFGVRWEAYDGAAPPPRRRQIENAQLTAELDRLAAGGDDRVIKLPEETFQGLGLKVTIGGHHYVQLSDGRYFVPLTAEALRKRNITVPQDIPPSHFESNTRKRADPTLSALKLKVAAMEQMARDVSGQIAILEENQLPRNANLSA